jgi:hypothetical protein
VHPFSTELFPKKEKVVSAGNLKSLFIDGMKDEENNMGQNKKLGMNTPL